jgi:hypothetical protein
MRQYRQISLMALFLMAAVDAFGAGGTAAAFLKVAVGAKNVALGETGAAFRDANAAYWNPAGLTGVTGHSISVMHAVWLEDVSLQNASYAQKVGNGAMAVSASYLGVPEIMKYDNTGMAENSSYRPSDAAIWLSYARQMRGLPLGISIKYIKSDIDGNTASAVAADLGAMLQPYMLAGRELYVGFAVQNIGSKMKFLRNSDPLPFNLKAGAWYDLSKSFGAALDVNKTIDSDPVANGGLQYQYQFEGQTYVAARAGVRTNAKDLGGMAGLTSGIGVGYRGLEIDYAFVPYGDLADTHRFSLRYNF